MKAAFVKDSKVAVEDIEAPKLGKGEIMVQMHACGICGADV